MILLSRVIKSSFARSNDEGKRVIGLQKIGTFSDDAIELHQAQEDLLKINAQATNILEEAKQKADKLLQQARSELDSTRHQIENELHKWEQEKKELIALAKDEGYSFGLKEGNLAGLNQYQDLLREARNIIDASKNEYQSLIESSEETILELGVKVAERILGKQLEEHKEDFLHLVNRARKEASEYTQIQIFVHPLQYEFVISQKDELVSLVNKETTLYIYPNEDLTELGCMIESSFGRIDASVDSQLLEIRNKLLTMLEGE